MKQQRVSATNGPVCRRGPWVGGHAGEHIVGAGSSGTVLVVTSLSRHTSVTNRDYCRRALPETEVRPPLLPRPPASAARSRGS